MLVSIAASATVHFSAVIGKAPRRLIQHSDTRCDTRETTSIGERVDIGAYCVVTAGSTIGDDCVLDDFSWLDGDVTLGTSVLVLYRAQICRDTIIENNCVIGGFIGERSRIGRHCRVFGNLIHSQRQRDLPWDSDAVEEPAPVLEERVFVGFGANIVGGVLIGQGAIIAASAVVTKDVPAEHVVTGINKAVPLNTWKGQLRGK